MGFRYNIISIAYSLNIALYEGKVINLEVAGSFSENSGRSQCHATESHGR